MKSLGNFPDPFIAEIFGQPEALRRAGAGLVEQRSTFEELATKGAGSAIVFTGMGSSYDACYPAVTELARAGIASVMLDSAELLHFRRGMLDASTLLVAVSQSGQSAEVVRLVESLDPVNRPLITSVTNGSANTLAGLADLSIDTRVGHEVGPSTMTFGAALVALAAVAAALTGDNFSEIVDRVGAGAVAAVIEGLLASPSLPDEMVSWLGDRRTVVILGRGPARAAAEMGALTIKEAAGIAVESLQTAQFRHGPLELAGSGLAAIMIATEAETLEIDIGLAAELIASGAGVLLVTAGVQGPPGAVHVEIGSVPDTLAPAASIVPIQLLAWRLAALRGREPGAYYRASKVTSVE